MKHLTLILLCTGFLFCAGCAGRLLNKVPEAEVTKFSYHRGGNITSADIQAENARITGDTLQIESLSISEDWGPAANVIIHLEGYKRRIK